MLPLPRFLFSEFIPYLLQYTFYINQYLLVLEAYDTETYLFKMCGANLVVFYLLTFCMIRAIYFHHQHSVKAYEINYIIIDNMLTSEIYSQLLLSQVLPQQ